MPQPLIETARIVGGEVDVLGDGSGHIVSTNLLKGALKGIENDIEDDALNILCQLSETEVRAVRRYFRASLARNFPLFYEDTSPPLKPVRPFIRVPKGPCTLYSHNWTTSQEVCPTHKCIHFPDGMGGLSETK